MNEKQFIYFTKTNGIGLLDNTDLSRISGIVLGNEIDPFDIVAIKNFAKTLKGIKELKRPSIKYLLKNNMKYMAIKYYRNCHNCTLMEAKEAIEKIEEKIGDVKHV